MYAAAQGAALQGAQNVSQGRRVSSQFSGFSGVGAIVALFVPTGCSGGRGMWGIFGKPLKRAIWNTPGLHAVRLRFSSVLDDACVVCCLFLSTGSCHVFIQIHSTGCCFPQCTTKAFGLQKGTLWGCNLEEGDSGTCQAGQEASYRRFTATFMHPQGARHSDDR